MNQLKKPILMILAVIITLVMVRLGFWQLGRADDKQVILDQVLARVDAAPVDLAGLSGMTPDNARFTPVIATGAFLPDHTVYIDNQVLDTRVGFKVFSPFKLAESERVVLVDRGWIAMGESREQLPAADPSIEPQTLQGRLNLPPAAPPLWDDEFAVSGGALWQFLPIDEYAAQTGLDVMPLVLELAPDSSSEPGLVQRWQTPDDQWVARHHAYALQWFAMAAVFFIACLILTVRSLRQD